ncbi:MAG: UxaA family hydrolase, partial [Clostridia bacterium]|nr:UxaA family hydrolase [Clostridia bacterium]
MDTFKINPIDNVCVDLQSGHKIACQDINEGEDVIKYGMPIGQATCFIKSGDSVHSHNLKTKLGDLLNYKYSGGVEDLSSSEPFVINAYVRKNGDIGIRNDVFIIPTVGCVNSTAKAIADKTGAVHVAHPYGCSQLGDDMAVTQKVLKGIIKHPNAGGVLVLGLGCENNNIDEMKKVLGCIDTDRIKFLNTQDCGDEISEGVEIVTQLQGQAVNDKRQPVSASRLKIGLKCGGSDGYSGITANPVVGVVTDKLVSMGATAVLTEVPEMFGAETVLFERCESETVFNKCVSLINDFKQYFKDHGEPVSENPSPGNKEGGITT